MPNEINTMWRSWPDGMLKLKASRRKPMTEQKCERPKMFPMPLELRSRDKKDQVKWLMNTPR